MSAAAPPSGLEPRARAWGQALAGGLLLALAAGSLWRCSAGEGSAAKAEGSPAAPARESVVAMARLEPRGRVVRVGVADGSVVARVLVGEGEQVRAGQVLAELEGHRLYEAEREAARLRLERTGLAPYDLDVQQQRVRFDEADLDHCRRQVRRQKELREVGLASDREYDESVLQATRAEHELAEARAVLEQLRKSTALSRQEAGAELRRATARLEQATVRAPLTGRVLRILAQAGERVGPQGLLQMGDTSEMQAVAEVHANDARLVRAGQKAVFSSAALPQPLEGTVAEVGSLIYRNDVFGEDPTAPENVRVVQVRIRLGPAATAAGLTNLEGQVRISVAGPL